MILFLFIPIYFLSSYFYQTKKTVGLSLILGMLTFSILISFSTELLSYFHLFNRQGLITFWTSITGILIITHSKKKYSLYVFITDISKKMKYIFLKTSLFYKTITILLTLLILLIIIQGISYPPNNWDSMTYHLARISHWILNNSVENYPTNITRQIYSPPFSEYTIAQTSILENSDVFNNIVQLLYHLSACIVVVEILKLFTNNKNIHFFAFCLSITLPEAVLQASSTQNDLVHTFFLLCALFFSVKFLKEFKIEHASWLGVAIGFALLSKIIAFFYVPALLLLLGVLTILNARNKKEKLPLLAIGISAIIVITINLNFTLRKFDFSNNLSGTSEKIEDGITFNKYGPKLLLSTCIKNIALHADPFFVNNFGNIFAEKSHLLIGKHINEKGTNVFDMKFNAVSSWKNHEDSQPNFIVLTLFFICINILCIQIILKKRKWFSIEMILLLLIILQFITLNLIIRWEPWNSRIHTPIFFEIIIFCCIVFTNNKNRIQKLKRILIIISISYATFITVFNYTRPFFNYKKITSQISISDSRYKKYFMNQPLIYPEFQKFHTLLTREKKQLNIGYISHLDGWEYPITCVIFEKHNINFDHIRVSNSSSKYVKNKDYTYIFSSYIKQDTIHHNSKVYKNLSPKNNFLFYYKKINSKI